MHKVVIARSPDGTCFAQIRFVSEEDKSPSGSLHNAKSYELIFGRPHRLIFRGPLSGSAVVMQWLESAARDAQVKLVFETVLNGFGWQPNTMGRHHLDMLLVDIGLNLTEMPLEYGADRDVVHHIFVRDDDKWYKEAGSE
jgi:hypothetical protein